LWAAHIGISNLRPQHHGDAKDDPIFKNAEKNAPPRLLNCINLMVNVYDLCFSRG
jgi:hypothetical protein